MKKKYIGVAFIIVGAALAFWGYDIYDSASAQISRAFNGDSPVEAWVGMIGGFFCMAFGLFQLK